MVILSNLVLLASCAQRDVQPKDYPEQFLLEQQHLNEVLDWERSNGWQIHSASEGGIKVTVDLSQVYSRAGELSGDHAWITREHADDFQTSIRYHYTEKDSIISYIEYSWGIPIDNEEAMLNSFSRDKIEAHEEALWRFERIKTRFEEALGSGTVKQDSEEKTAEVQWVKDNFTTVLSVRNGGIGAKSFWE